MAWEDRRRRSIFDLFNDFFDSIFADFEEDSKFRDMPKPRRNVKGFSIRIKQVPGQQPKVEVQKFSPEGAKKVKPIKVEVVEAKKKIKLVKEKKKEKSAKPVKFEQPEVFEGRDKKGNFVEITMPGIKNANQINLNVLEQSIEVKAIDRKEGKGYFWIVKIPPGAKKVTKLLSKGKFRLYFS
jgi:hypothetical protein